MATTIVADWKLEETLGRVYGVCYIEFSPPFDKFDFTQGFSLPNPTHVRCALQAIATALEAIRGCAFLKDCPCIALATKNALAHKMLTDPNCARKWIDAGKWPKSQAANKALLGRAFEMLEADKKDVVTFICIDRDENDRAYVDLDEGRTEDGCDVGKMTGDGKTPEQIDKELRDTRMRGVMAKKLIGTGARSFRAPKKKV